MRSQNRPKQTGVKKAPSSAWQPGQSGNPGGRPKVAAEIRDLARHHGPRAIERLVTLLDSKNEGVVVRAAEALLDRGYGRPMQAMELREKDDDPARRCIKVVFVDHPKRTDSVAPPTGRPTPVF